MSEAFTPGPWRLGPNGIQRDGRKGEIVRPPRVTSIYAPYYHSNARLIAAAPDLYAAAKAAIAYDAALQQCESDPAIMMGFPTAQGDTLDAMYIDWISKARAALAKARGE